MDILINVCHHHNKMKRQIIIFIFLLLLVPLISADTYQVDQPLDLKIPFEVNGSTPSTSATCNVSLKYPNGTYVVEKASMTNLENGEFNHTFTNISAMGTYKWTAFCCDGVLCAGGYGDFSVNRKGVEELTSGQSIPILVALGVIVITGILFFIATIKSEMVAFKIIFGGLSMLMLIIAALFTSVIFTQTLSNYPDLETGVTSFWMVVRVIAGISLLGVILYAGWASLRLWKWKRGRLD